MTAQSGSAQTVAAEKTYDAFGQVVSSSGTWYGGFGYGGSFGYQSDADYGLQLLGHRYYDASTGRFLTRDSIKDGRNWYGYCENNPIAWADMDGLQMMRVYKNPGGGGLGSHIIIGIGRDKNSLRRFGFYPKPKDSQGGSSSSGGGMPGHGSGYIEVGDVPGKKAEIIDISLTWDEYDSLLANIMQDVKDYNLSGKGKRKYDLKEHNCVDWAADIIDRSLQNSNGYPGKLQKKKSKLLTPTDMMTWLHGWNGNAP